MDFSSKNSLKGIGLMTGTSCDGIDISLVEFNESTSKLLKVLATETSDFPIEAAEFVSKIIATKVSISEISQYNFYLSQLFAERIIEFLNFNGIKKADVDFIAVHGQTLWHNPSPEIFLNKNISSTYQAINLSAMAKLTGIPVIGDFRSGDIALGGQGAPLVPIFDYDFFSSNEKDRILVNIGGISNLTYIAKGSKEILAFDCGPGNTLIDLASRKYLSQKLDINGENAKVGNLNEPMLSLLLADNFISAYPPKSTGREKYNEEFLEGVINQLDFEIDVKDILRTLTEFTAEAIRINIEKFCSEEYEIIISGGGRNNKFLMELLKSKLFKSEFKEIEDFGIPSDAKESIAFAYLGWLFLKGKQGNIPTATGAKFSTLLGVIAY